MCVFIAFYVFLLLFLFKPDIDKILFLIWLQIPIYLLHQFEEHAISSGFKDFVNKKVFKILDGDYPLNDMSIFWINIPIVWVFMPLFAALSHINLQFGLWLPYFSIINSTIHVIAFLRFKTYNPGLMVSLFLNIPVGIYAIIIFYQAGLITNFINISAIAISILLHLIIIMYMRRAIKRERRSI